MTKATKQKLENLNKTIDVLQTSAAGKQKTITFLMIGVVGVAALVMFIVLGRRKRG